MNLLTSLPFQVATGLFCFALGLMHHYGLFPRRQIPKHDGTFARLIYPQPEQPERRIIEARYRVDAATGMLREQVLEEVRAELIPTKAEQLARRDWTQPEDPECLEHNDRSGLYWTAKEDEDLLAYFCAGVSPEGIAEEHGRSVYAVAKRLEQKHKVLFTRKGQGFFVVTNKQPWGTKK